MLVRWCCAALLWCAVLARAPTRVMVVFGTRPEAIKLAPVVRALRAAPRAWRVTAVAVGQHRELLSDEFMAPLGGGPADVRLDVMERNQSLAGVGSRVLESVGRVLREEAAAGRAPELVLVQGDTSTALMAGLGAFYAGAAVAHVEAGLRTGDLAQPFPEEAHRKALATFARHHLAPTDACRAALLAEGVAPADVLVSGNTVIDALLQVTARPPPPELAVLLAAARGAGGGSGVTSAAAAAADEEAGEQEPAEKEAEEEAAEEEGGGGWFGGVTKAAALAKAKVCVLRKCKPQAMDCATDDACSEKKDCAAGCTTEACVMDCAGDSPSAATAALAQCVVQAECVAPGGKRKAKKKQKKKKKPAANAAGNAAGNAEAPRLLLVTAHRRENHAKLPALCAAVRAIVAADPSVRVLWPVHPNPAVHGAVHAALDGHEHVTLCAPLGYAAFAHALKAAHLVLSDSGGVQEEAPALGVPVLVLREVSARREGVEQGSARMVGMDEAAIVAAALRLLRNGTAHAEAARVSLPYGDGKSAARIEAWLRQRLRPGEEEEEEEEDSAGGGGEPTGGEEGGEKGGEGGEEEDVLEVLDEELPEEEGGAKAASASAPPITALTTTAKAAKKCIIKRCMSEAVDCGGDDACSDKKDCAVACTTEACVRQCTGAKPSPATAALVACVVRHGCVVSVGADGKACLGEACAAGREPPAPTPPPPPPQKRYKPQVIRAAKEALRRREEAAAKIVAQRKAEDSGEADVKAGARAEGRTPPRAPFRAKTMGLGSRGEEEYAKQVQEEERLEKRRRDTSKHFQRSVRVQDHGELSDNNSPEGRKKAGVRAAARAAAVTEKRAKEEAAQKIVDAKREKKRARIAAKKAKKAEKAQKKRMARKERRRLRDLKDPEGERARKAKTRLRKKTTPFRVKKCVLKKCVDEAMACAIDEACMAKKDCAMACTTEACLRKCAGDDPSPTVAAAVACVVSEGCVTATKDSLLGADGEPLVEPEPEWDGFGSGEGKGGVKAYSEKLVKTGGKGTLRDAADALAADSPGAQLLKGMGDYSAEELAELAAGAIESQFPGNKLPSKDDFAKQFATLKRDDGQAPGMAEALGAVAGMMKSGDEGGMARGALEGLVQDSAKKHNGDFKAAAADLASSMAENMAEAGLGESFGKGAGGGVPGGAGLAAAAAGGAAAAGAAAAAAAAGAYDGSDGSGEDSMADILSALGGADDESGDASGDEPASTGQKKKKKKKGKMADILSALGSASPQVQRLSKAMGGAAPAGPTDMSAIEDAFKDADGNVDHDKLNRVRGSDGKGVSWAARAASLEAPARCRPARAHHPAPPPLTCLPACLPVYVARCCLPPAAAAAAAAAGHGRAHGRARGPCRGRRHGR